MWIVWRPRLKWRNLCPVLFADPLGICVVMARADPLSSDAQRDLAPDYYPDMTVEGKADDYGVLGGEVVIIDYGLPYRDAIEERRLYLRSFGEAAAKLMP